jgi:hypothetical protein
VPHGQESPVNPQGDDANNSMFMRRLQQESENPVQAKKEIRRQKTLKEMLGKDDKSDGQNSRKL